MYDVNMILLKNGFLFEYFFNERQIRFMKGFVLVSKEFARYKFAKYEVL